MTGEIGQAVGRERLRARLVQLRRRADLTPAQVCRRTRWSISKLSRIETGAVTVQPTDVQALLSIYGVADEAEVAEFMELAVLSRRRQWWSNYGLTPEYRDFVAYEDEATHIVAYQPLFLPGLLQTHAYAKAIAESLPPREPDDLRIKSVIDVRLTRQRHVFARMERPDGPHLTALLDGAVLERRVGGRKVMREQLTHLVELNAHPHIDVVIMPLTRGVYPGLGEVFDLLRFAGSEDPDVVFIESSERDFLIKDRAVTAGYRHIADAIAAVGLRGEDAATEIMRIRDTISDGAGD